MGPRVGIEGEGAEDQRAGRIDQAPVRRGAGAGLPVEGDRIARGGGQAEDAGQVARVERAGGGGVVGQRFTGGQVEQPEGKRSGGVARAVHRQGVVAGSQQQRGRATEAVGVGR